MSFSPTGMRIRGFLVLPRHDPLDSSRAGGSSDFNRLNRPSYIAELPSSAEPRHLVSGTTLQDKERKRSSLNSKETLPNSGKDLVQMQRFALLKS